MIKITENFDEYNFVCFEDDIFFQRIYSDYRTLSCFKDAMFYVCEENNEVTAVISKVGATITVSAKENAQFDEINEFAKVIGFATILCENKFSSYFDGKKTSGSILKIRCDTKQNSKADKLYAENLTDMHKLIKSVFDIEPEFADWFADMCHLMRHGAAKFCGVYSDEVLVSAGFSLFTTQKSAVISSVATHEDFRHKGYGKEVIKFLISENYGRDVYVFTENVKTENWYKNMGFVPYKKWSEIENVL